MNLGVPELIIILVIVVLLFGASRISGVGSALGSSIREFKKAMRDDEAADTQNPHEAPGQRPR